MLKSSFIKKTNFAFRFKPLNLLSKVGFNLIEKKKKSIVLTDFLKKIFKKNIILK